MGDLKVIAKESTMLGFISNNNIIIIFIICSYLGQNLIFKNIYIQNIMFSFLERPPISQGYEVNR